MSLLRTSILRQPLLAALLVALALAMRALVPAGYRIEGSTRAITVSICAESLGQKLVQTLALPAKPSDVNKARADSPCAFTVLAHGASGAVAGFAALVLLFLAALVPAPPLPAALCRIAYGRPHPRGPPRR